MQKRKPLQTDMLCFVSFSKTLHCRRTCRPQHAYWKLEGVVKIPCPFTHARYVFEKGDKALEPSVSYLNGPSDTRQTNKSLASYYF